MIQHGRRAFAIALAFALLVAVSHFSSALAQDITGTLQGNVVGPDGGPEPQVRVAASGRYLQGTRETTTDRAGFFQLLALPPGRYELKLSRLGLQPLEVHELVIELGRTAVVGPITMSPKPIELAAVVVERAPLKLEPVHTSAGGNLAARDYDALPVDRDYKSLISVLPQVNRSYRGDAVNVGGSTGLENQYYIDGINVTDSRLADRATSLPHNFVREVDVKSGGYEAQYGRALGAVVNAVTYSGTNDPEANVFGFVQPVAFSMVPRGTSAIAEAGAVDYDFGARVSGPVRRDRLWYSLAVNPRFNRVNKEIVGHGFFPDRSSAVRFASKLTWRPSAANNVELSVFGDPSVEDVIQAPPTGFSSIADPNFLLKRVESGGTTASLRDTWAPSRSLLVQAALALQWDRYNFAGSAPPGSPLSYYDDVTGTASGGNTTHGDEQRGRTTLTARGTLLLTRHTVVGGIEYEDQRAQSSAETHFIEHTEPSQWIVDHERYAGVFHNRSPVAYLQDSWRLTDRLALNEGLRWSGQYMAGASGHTAQKITDEWQPRAGFSWQLDRAERQRVFGSYGRFYETLPTNIPVLFFVDYFMTYDVYTTDPRLPGATPSTPNDWSTPEALYAHQIAGLHAENTDEFTLGWERLVGRESRLTVRGMHRALRSSFQWGFDPNHNPAYVLGTPGQGDLGFLPEPKRQYTALEVSAEGAWQDLRYRASWVWSRTWGNYPGLFNSDMGLGNPGLVTTFGMPGQELNSTGCLPNDRPHVVKLSTSYELRSGLVGGANFSFESGAPINAFAPASPYAQLQWPRFLVQRGTAGRTPRLWNLDLRFACPLHLTGGRQVQLLADILHVGNFRRATAVDEYRYLSLDSDGNPATPNPHYGQPISYQPPMAGRVGLQMSF